MSFYYSIIPSSVMYDTKLTDGAKILYALILSLANNKGLCDASNEYLASMTKKSERTIKYQIKELIDNDYIKVDYQQFKKRVIYPIWKISQSTEKKAVKLYTSFLDEQEQSEIMQNVDKIFKNIGRKQK